MVHQSPRVADSGSWLHVAITIYGVHLRHPGCRSNRIYHQPGWTHSCMRICGPCGKTPTSRPTLSLSHSHRHHGRCYSGKKCRYLYVRHPRTATSVLAGIYRGCRQTQSSLFPASLTRLHHHDQLYLWNDWNAERCGSYS